MAINHNDNNIKLIEQTLDHVVQAMFKRAKMAPAEWDMDKFLRLALYAQHQLLKFDDLIRRYDETFDLAIKSNIKINDKYKNIYKLKEIKTNYGDN